MKILTRHYISSLKSNLPKTISSVLCVPIFPGTHNACRHPDDLYKGGLQRELFLPFIKRLKEETEVHDMASPVDYRRLAHHRKGLYFSPRDSKNPDGELTEHFAHLAANAGGDAPEPREIAVQMGRKLHVPLAGTYEHPCTP